MDRSPSRLLQNAGGSVASGGPAPSESQHDQHDSLVRRNTRAADHARGQVLSALDGLLGDDVPFADGGRTPGQSGAGGRRSRVLPEPISIDAQHDAQLSPTRKASAVPVDSSGYTPTAAGGRRRRSSVRSPKSYGMGAPQGQGVQISTLEGLQVFLDEKQKEVVKAHARRTNELETTLLKEENYFSALLDNELEKKGVKLKATSAMLKGGNSVANNLFRRGSRRLSKEGVDDALLSKHSDDVKKSNHLRKKLKAHHEEARTVLAKKLQVESARMGRVIKTNLGKYANPKLAQSAKAAVLASVVEYLNGEEFVRIVTAPLIYKSPDFVRSTEAELGAMGVSFSPTNAGQRSMSSLPVEAIDYDSKMAQLQEQRMVEQQQRMADEAIRHKEMLERENKAAMEQDVADALAKAHEENLRRQEDMQRQQDEELEQQRRQLGEHQERLRREADLARMRHKEELDRRRAEMEREREAVRARQAEAKRLQEEELSRQREELQRQHEEGMERQRQEIVRHAEDVARHKAELAKHNEEARLEQEALEELRRRAKEEEEEERRRLEAELAKHQEEMRLEAERVKMEMEALKLERESVARAEEEERAAEAEASRVKAAQKAAEDLRAALDEQQRKASEAAIRIQIEAELEERVARDIQAERDRVAAESAALQAKIREFEEQKEAAAKKAAVEEDARRAIAEREAALAARERVAAESLALGRALSEKAKLGATAPNGNVPSGRSLTSNERPESGSYRVGDKVEALCTPVGAAVGMKAYIAGEVAHRNPDGSLDIILSDGRMRQDVPLAEIRFIQRSEPPSSAGSSISAASTASDNDGDDDGEGSEVAVLAAAWAASARDAGGENYRRDSPSAKHLLDQTLSFGSLNGRETDEDPKDDVPNPQRAVRSGSLDDILAKKVRAAEEAERNTSAHSGATGGSGDRADPGEGGDRGEGGEGRGGRAPAKKRVSLDEIMGIKVGQVVRGSTRIILQEGDTVEALDASPDGSSTFKQGVIRRIHGDGRVDVDLEAGGKLVRRPTKEVRLVRKGRGSTAAAPAAALSSIALGDLAVGDRVEARYGGKPEHCPGVVTSTEDGVSVNFDGGWHGASIPLRNVRRLGPSPGSGARPQGGRAKPPGLSAGAQLRSTGCILDLDVGSLGGDTFSVGDQVQFRNNRAPREGPPETHDGVIRSAHPNGSYLVGFKNGTTRDQVLASCLTDFGWTTHGSEAYRRAATGNSQGTTSTTQTSPAKKNAISGEPNGETGGSGGAGGSGGRKGYAAGGSVPDRSGLSKSWRKSVFDKFGSPGKILPEGALRWTAGMGEGGGVRDSAAQRRATHDGVVASTELGLRVDMMHFRPQDFMDPDTAAQAILTPNNAGMFRHRGRQGQLGGGHHQMLSELSYNSTTDDSDAERSECISDEGRDINRGPAAKNVAGKKSEESRRPNTKGASKGSSFAGPGNAPKRRMTFGGIRSDKRGEVYKAQRRPSFLDEVGRRAVQAAEATAKLARRISIQGNNGQGFELVAIRDRKESVKNTTGRKSAREGGRGGDGENSSDSELCENQTHFYNRTRHVFEPQHMEIAPSAWWIRTCGVVNLICMAAYLWWRCMRSLIGVKHIIWAYIFLTAECIMAIGMIVGHSSRSFPVHREKVYMDDLTQIDDAIGALKVTVLVPTCGEKTAVMLKALFGNLQLRLWKSRNARRETLRVVVLDEKRREEVQKLVSLVYTLAEVVLDKIVREILMREGVAPISAKGFYDHFANGQNGQRMYDDVNFIRGIEIVAEIDKLIAANDDTVSRFSPSVAISRIKERARRASCFDRKEIQPGQKKVWNRNKYIPTIVYYSRIDAGQPRISPKAGNMNRAIFSFNPQEEPLIGEAAVVVVNDVRHELYPEFLQRTVPYFFTFDKVRRCYKWANIAFIQTPQRFHDRDDWNDPDPLGNQAATQFDIVNCGRDGAGGALSCGQGSLWRVQVLRDGIRPDGTKFLKKGAIAEDQVGRQGGLGFRAEVLIEDTHTSIDLFRQGWRSVYVNFPKETLACCTLPPDTVKWRWKQVLRWHQGAVQLAMWKGWKYAVFGENWGTLFQKVFAFDAVSYFLQAFAGEILLIFPVVYGFTNSAPFNTWNIEFALYFFPFIITGILPTVAALGWQKTPSAKVMRDEQIWFATSFVQIYAVLHAVWGTITRKDPSNAWECKCPVWPLHLHFVAIIGAVCYNTADWAARSYEEPWVWVSCIGSAMFALHSLWPVVSFGLGVTMPEAFYTRVFGMLVVMTLVSMWLLGESG